MPIFASVLTAALTAPSEACLSAREEVVVQVVAPDGKAVEGADCLVVTDVDIDYDLLELRAEQEGRPEQDEVFRWFGRPVRSDGSGELRVTVPGEGGVHVLAETAAARGMLSLHAGSTERTLQLIARRSLRLTVVDFLGQPVVGAPMAVQSLQEYDGREFVNTISEGTTDAEGVARISGLEMAWFEMDRPRLVVTPAFPLGRTARLALPDGPGEQELRFTLPPTGAIEFALKDASVQQVNAVVSLAGSEALVVEPLAVPFVDGIARVPHVGLGLSLEVRAIGKWIQDGEPMAFEGPTRPGRAVRVEVEALPLCRVVGRLLDLRGEPVAKRSLSFIHWEVDGGDRSGSHSSLRTDDEGRFRLGIVPEPAESKAQHLLEFSEYDRDSGQETVLAVIEIDDLRSGQELIELGDVRVGMGPTVATGRVVSTGGDPIPDALVSLQVAMGGGRWRDHHGEGDCLSDEGGWFELISAGVDEDEAYGVSARADGWYPLQTVAIPELSADVEVVMAEAGSFSHPNYLHGRDRAHLHLGWRLEPRTSSVTLPQTDPFEWWEQERARYESLPPGSYEFVLLCHGVEIRRIGPLAVVAGEELRDERLEALSIDDLVDVVELRVLGSGGRPLGSNRYQVWQVSHGSGRITSRSVSSPMEEDGEPVFHVTVARGHPLEVEIEADGYRTELVEIAQSMEVELRPALKLHLALRGASPVLSGDVGYAFALVPKGEPHPRGRVRWIQFVGIAEPSFFDEPELSFFDERGEAVVFVEAAGDYELCWAVGGVSVVNEHLLEGIGQMLLVDAFELSVDEVNEEQLIELLVDEELAQAATDEVEDVVKALAEDR